MRYRKRPIVIEATQWFPGVVIPDVEVAAGGVFIATLEGIMRVSPGDWIITGVNGERYPCKPDIFAKTYTLADMPDAVTAERERWRAASRALLEAMPRCSFCDKVATRAHARGSARYCDDHGVNVREYPRAAPLLALQAMVDEKESGK